MAQYVEHTGGITFTGTAPRLLCVFEYEAEPVFLFPPEQDFQLLLDWLETAHPAFFDLICHAAERIVAERDD
jgi:hypothetical protein